MAVVSITCGHVESCFRHCYTTIIMLASRTLFGSHGSTRNHQPSGSHNLGYSDISPIVGKVTRADTSKTRSPSRGHRQTPSTPPPYRPAEGCHTRYHTPWPGGSFSTYGYCPHQRQGRQCPAVIRSVVLERPSTPLKIWIGSTENPS